MGKVGKQITHLQQLIDASNNIVFLGGAGVSTENVSTESIRAIHSADLLIVGGTSLTVHPAAGLIGCKNKSAKLVIINLSSTPYDEKADLLIHAKIGEVFENIF